MGGEERHRSAASSLDLPVSAASITPSLHRSDLADEFTAAGTPLYAAPEVLRTMFENKAANDDVINHKNDVWALGILALEASLGYHPLACLERSNGGGAHMQGGGKGVMNGECSTSRGQLNPHQHHHQPQGGAHYNHAYSGNNGNVLYNIAHLAEVPIPNSSSSPASPAIPSCSSSVTHDDDHDDEAASSSASSFTSSSSPPSLLGPELREVLVSMVKTDPKERLTASQVLETFPWLQASSTCDIRERADSQEEQRATAVAVQCLPLSFELVECWEL